jgi:hypothetical protein
MREKTDRVSRNELANNEGLSRESMMEWKANENITQFGVLFTAPHLANNAFYLICYLLVTMLAWYIQYM